MASEECQTSIKSNTDPDAGQPKQVSLYQMYRKLKEEHQRLQAENNKLKAENTILQNLIESWTNRFGAALESSIKSETQSHK